MDGAQAVGVPLCNCVLSPKRQTEHYKLDWHRFNLRQKVAGMAPATAEEFEEKTGAGEDDPPVFAGI